ncbi:hypothetical protein BDN70DRAFT_933377 [Pholiota conissans]|uniref:Transmembrane protein n=1 Tax=Pholiota conissans TaxID=109636 RepID=A0A9P5Z0F7_9AGAR|nr:hypothetical protein BDN70DRAFT_933377 [Pholiota conissans]
MSSSSTSTLLVPPPVRKASHDIPKFFLVRFQSPTPSPPQIDVAVITQTGSVQPVGTFMQDVDHNPTHSQLAPPVSSWNTYLCNRLISVYFIPTLGIAHVYYFRYRCVPGDAPEILAERGSAPPYHRRDLPHLDRETTLIRIASSWRTILGLSSGGVLASVMGFIQLLSVCNNVIFTSLTLGSVVLVWSSFICGFLYTGYKESFLRSRVIAEQWTHANSANCPFWRLVALPAILLSWGFLLCCFAILYVSFTGFGNTQPASCGTVNLPTAAGGIFVLGVMSISGTLIYNAIVNF